MRERLLAILEEVRPEIDFDSETGFIEQGLFDSLDIVTIVDSICEEFDVEIGFDEIKGENFNSIANMLEMISKYSQ